LRISTASKSFSGGAGQRDLAHLGMHHVARAPGQVARLAGRDAMAAPLRLAHHREGGVLVDLEDLERVGNEKKVHRSELLHKSPGMAPVGLFGRRLSSQRWAAPS